jgi:hypothetical protein
MASAHLRRWNMIDQFRTVLFELSFHCYSDGNTIFVFGQRSDCLQQRETKKIKLTFATIIPSPMNHTFSTEAAFSYTTKQCSFVSILFLNETIFPNRSKIRYKCRIRPLIASFSFNGDNCFFYNLIKERKKFLDVCKKKKKKKIRFSPLDR